jgi:hypothetical protein
MASVNHTAVQKCTQGLPVLFDAFNNQLAGCHMSWGCHPRSRLCLHHAPATFSAIEGLVAGCASVAGTWSCRQKDCTAVHTCTHLQQPRHLCLAEHNSHPVYM